MFRHYLDPTPGDMHVNSGRTRQMCAYVAHWNTHWWRVSPAHVIPSLSNSCTRCFLEISNNNEWNKIMNCCRVKTAYATTLRYGWCHPKAPCNLHTGRKKKWSKKKEMPHISRFFQNWSHIDIYIYIIYSIYSYVLTYTLWISAQSLYFLWESED